MRLRHLIGLAICAPVLLANDGGCDSKPTAAGIEQAQQDLQMQQFLRNQPVPSFDWSLERHMLIQLYAARQKATNTYSFVQSEYTGKVLWQCPSIGFPLPYATQLTNPQQLTWRRFDTGPSRDTALGVVAQQEPNGLFTPSTADATWVPCVDDKGKITPVYRGTQGDRIPAAHAGAEWHPGTGGRQRGELGHRAEAMNGNTALEWYMLAKADGWTSKPLSPDEPEHVFAMLTKPARAGNLAWTAIVRTEPKGILPAEVTIWPPDRRRTIRPESYDAAMFTEPDQRRVESCRRHGLDPFELVADGGYEAWQAVTDWNLNNG